MYSHISQGMTIKLKNTSKKGLEVDAQPKKELQKYPIPSSLLLFSFISCPTYLPLHFALEFDTFIDIWLTSSIQSILLPSFLPQDDPLWLK